VRLPVTRKAGPSTAALWKYCLFGLAGEELQHLVELGILEEIAVGFLRHLFLQRRKGGRGGGLRGGSGSGFGGFRSRRRRRGRDRVGNSFGGGRRRDLIDHTGGGRAALQGENREGGERQGAGEDGDG
jgi:hypothetical protein